MSLLRFQIQMTQIIKFDLCLPCRGRGRRVGATFLLRTRGLPLAALISDGPMRWPDSLPGNTQLGEESRKVNTLLRGVAGTTSQWSGQTSEWLETRTGGRYPWTSSVRGSASSSPRSKCSRRRQRSGRESRNGAGRLWTLQHSTIITRLLLLLIITAPLMTGATSPWRRPGTGSSPGTRWSPSTSGWTSCPGRGTSPRSWPRTRRSSTCPGSVSRGTRPWSVRERLITGRIITSTGPITNSQYTRKYFRVNTLNVTSQTCQIHTVKYLISMLKRSHLP